MSRKQYVSIGLLALALGAAQSVSAQQAPTWGSGASGSPTAGSSTSNKANAAADSTMYQDIQYVNAAKQGPRLVVIPGEIKSNNASFIQRYGTNNIADWGELELSKANFQVLERADLGPLLNEIQLAYGAGDPDEARKVMGKGKLKTTKWIVKFDILKAEPVAKVQSGFNGGVASSLIGIFGRNNAPTAAAGTVTGSVDTSSASGVWVIGMRYKILDATTTDQVAQGYTEEKMEVGAKRTSVAGISNSAEGGITLDTMVQRLVQKSVWDIDSKYK
jgi:curli biogenesis system outer membrane secretion channel CsgG